MVATIDEMRAIARSLPEKPGADREAFKALLQLAEEWAEELVRAEGADYVTRLVDRADELAGQYSDCDGEEYADALYALLTEAPPC